MSAPPRFVLLSLLPCVLLAGCKLVDQRTFDHDAGRKPVPHAPAAVASGPPPVPPLFVVRPAADWRGPLREAVREALARKPNVLFTVDSVVPTDVSPARQTAAMQTTVMQLGRPVADAIAADGARPDQIELAASSDRTVHQPQVRIDVR
ncbi:hypothetical protein [Lichenicoccus sp.]|uniref:hypothetical protein n=1 Tax=Lichenicoccus sp. TaxID=2781899 RepID=UPI003D0C82A4